jgi:hypothetical protein
MVGNILTNTVPVNFSMDVLRYMGGEGMKRMKMAYDRVHSWAV